MDLPSRLESSLESALWFTVVAESDSDTGSAYQKLLIIYVLEGVARSFPDENSKHLNTFDDPLADR